MSPDPTPPPEQRPELGPHLPDRSAQSAEDADELHALREQMRRIGYLPDPASEAAAALSEDRSAAIAAQIHARRLQIDQQHHQRTSRMTRSRRRDLADRRVAAAPRRSAGSLPHGPRIGLVLATAVVLVLAVIGVAQPWKTPAAAAETPPLL